jgi:hypothetical protein
MAKVVHSYVIKKFNLSQFQANTFMKAHHISYSHGKSIESKLPLSYAISSQIFGNRFIIQISISVGLNKNLFSIKIQFSVFLISIAIV